MNELNVESVSTRTYIYLSISLSSSKWAGPIEFCFYNIRFLKKTKKKKPKKKETPANLAEKIKKKKPNEQNMGSSTCTMITSLDRLVWPIWLLFSAVLPFRRSPKVGGGGRGGIVVSAPHGTLGMRPLKCHLEETEPRRNHCSSLSLLSFITFF